MSTKPVVSIISLTYNQEKYVKDCFEGFLMQQTSFPFEVLVYDDASTDATPEIIRQYAIQYPDIFKPTLYKENNFSRGLGYVGLYDGIKNAQGKYVAYCEGDDYWTDPLKLQKQVDFLDSHQEYEICAHEVQIRCDSNAQRNGMLFSKFENNFFIPTTWQNYNFDNMLTGNIYHVSSMMYRNFPVILPQWINKVSACDMVLFRLLAEKGDLYVMHDVMSVYRAHSDSLTNSQKEYNLAINYYQKLSIPVLRLLNLFWNRKYQKKIFPIIARYYAECAVLYTNKGIRDFAQAKLMAKMACYYCKRTAIPHLFKGIGKKVLRIK